MILKPVPLIEAEFTVTAEVPVEVRVTEPVAAVLVATLPKARVVALTLSCGLAAAPKPLRDTTVELPVVELLPMVSVPVADPDAVGAN